MDTISVEIPNAEELQNASSVSISTRNLCYTIVKNKHLKYSLSDTNMSVKVTKEVQILNNITMCAQPGEVLMIMGPSGCGKTTLLNVLSGRTRNRRDAFLKGEICINGVYPKKEQMSKISNYVMQKEQLLEFLTVEETIEFNAKLKMKAADSETRKNKVEFLINNLGLQDCRHNLIGGSYKKGISGGEMKRVSIAVELLDSPSLLFLDEPTSGLDSSLAYDTLLLLLKLAKNMNKTIMCTVHQPRSQVFQMFDQLLLMSGGRTVYHGSAKGAVPYFEAMGYRCPASFNPADFLLDVLTVGSRPPPQIKNIFKTIKRIVSTGGGANYLEAPNQRTVEIRDAFNKSNFDATQMSMLTVEEIQNLPKMFLMSNEAKIIEDKISLVENQKNGKQQLKVELQEYLMLHRAAWYDWARQMVILMRRAFINSWRNPISSIIHIILHTMIGLLLGGLFFNVTGGDPTFGTVQNVLGCLFFFICNLGFCTLDSLLTFEQERCLFNRDVANGTYRPSSFFIAKNIVDLPFLHIPPLLFMVIAYWMAGLSPTWNQFFVFVFVGSTTIYSAAGFTYCIGCAAPSLNVAQASIPVLLVLFMLVSGFYISDADLPVWISWLKWLSFMRYGYFSLCVNEFPPGGTFGDLSTDDLISTVARIPITSIAALSVYQIALGSGFRVVAYIFLCFTNRHVGIES